MKTLLKNAYARLAARAALVGVTTALTQLHSSGPTLAWRVAAVAGALAFAEVFTPLNALVGVFKPQKPTPPTP